MGLFSTLFGKKTKEGTVELKYISTITTTLDVEFDETEDINNIKTKSINFIGEFLLINDIEVPHFKLIEASNLTKKWATEDQPSFMSHEIIINLVAKEVYYTVYVPTITGGIPVDNGLSVKPSKQTFTYSKDVIVENITLSNVEEYSSEVDALIEIAWAEAGNHDLAEFIKDSIRTSEGLASLNESFIDVMKAVKEEDSLWADQVMNSTDDSIMRQATYSVITNDLMDEYITEELANSAYSAYVLLARQHSLLPKIIEIIEEEFFDLDVSTQLLAERVLQMMRVRAVSLTENTHMRNFL